MPSSAFSSIGSEVSLSAGVPATFDAAGFGALTYTLIREITDIGMVGPESSVILHNPVSENTTYKVKGTRNNGSVDLKGARVTTDPGQTLLIAAEASNAPYSMRIKLQNGVFLYFQVLVMSYKTSIGGQNQITGIEAKCEVSGNVVTV